MPNLSLTQSLTHTFTLFVLLDDPCIRHWPCVTLETSSLSPFNIREGAASLGRRRSFWSMAPGLSMLAAGTSATPPSQVPDGEILWPIITITVPALRGGRVNRMGGVRWRILGHRWVRDVLVGGQTHPRSPRGAYTPCCICNTHKVCTVNLLVNFQLVMKLHSQTIYIRLKRDAETHWHSVGVCCGCVCEADLYFSQRIRCACCLWMSRTECARVWKLQATHIAEWWADPQEHTPSNGTAAEHTDTCCYADTRTHTLLPT